MKKTVNALMISVLFGVLLVFGVRTSIAAEPNWHAESDSYRVYMGVVPVSLIKKNPYLVDRDKHLHGGADKKHDSDQHVMVSVFSKKNNKRVLDATVIAEVKSGKILSRNKVERPLEKMVTSGTVTYGNYFSLPGDAEYEVEVKIYESNRDGAEKVEFVYKAM